MAPDRLESLEGEAWVNRLKINAVILLLREKGVISKKELEEKMEEIQEEVIAGVEKMEKK